MSRDAISFTISEMSEEHFTSFLTLMTFSLRRRQCYTIFFSHKNTKLLSFFYMVPRFVFSFFSFASESFRYLIT